MKYGSIKIYIIIAISICLSACSPQHRFARLVKNHPYLLDTTKLREVQIQTIDKIDTQFFFTKERDTIHFRDYRFERFRDTIRFLSKERNCTTFVYSTQIKPSKTIERYIREKQNKGLKGEIYERLMWLLLGLIISLILFKK